MHIHTCIYTHAYTGGQQESEAQELYPQVKKIRSQPIPNLPTGWRRPIGFLIFTGHFLQKRSIISGSSAKRDLQFEAFCASLPPCTT